MSCSRTKEGPVDQWLTGGGLSNHSGFSVVCAVPWRKQPRLSRPLIGFLVNGRRWCGFAWLNQLGPRPSSPIPPPAKEPSPPLPSPPSSAQQVPVSNRMPSSRPELAPPSVLFVAPTFAPACRPIRSSARGVGVDLQSKVLPVLRLMFDTHYRCANLVHPARHQALPSFLRASLSGRKEMNLSLRPFASRSIALLLAVLTRCLLSSAD